MKNKILTMQDLVNFCKAQNLYTFNSKDSGQRIIVQSEQDFSKAEIEEYKNKLVAEVKVCHTGLNRNGSFCSEKAMKKAMPTLKYAPFLGYIH